MRLQDYLDRIGVAGPLDRTIETVRRLHLAHREAFLFENLSIQIGDRISLALPDIEKKFLDQGRGGYCFEHSTLFAAALAELGLASTTLLGRVRRGPPDRRVRTHMVLGLEVDGRRWLADVGFGGLGLLEPMPLVDGASSHQDGLTYFLRRENGLWVLSMRDATSTTDLYEFTEEAQTPGDVEVANHFTSTHPESIFRRTLTIQRHRHGERTMLRNDLLIRCRDGRQKEEPIDRADLENVARDLFDVTLPRGPFLFETER